MVVDPAVLPVVVPFVDEPVVVPLAAGAPAAELPLELDVLELDRFVPQARGTNDLVSRTRHPFGGARQGLDKKSRKQPHAK